MLRRRPRPASSVRLVCSLLSVLALALALAPASALAGTPEYETEIPTVEGAKHIPTNKSPGATDTNNPPAKSSGAPTANGGAGDNRAGEGAEPSEETSHASNPSTAGSGGGGPNQSGKGGGGSHKGAEASIAQVKPVSSPAESNGGGGGSSPVLPIVIAVLVLGAISIGAVLYRQRRQGGGSSPANAG